MILHFIYPDIASLQKDECEVKHSEKIEVEHLTTTDLKDCTIQKELAKK